MEQTNEDRIADLLAKIPAGTICDDTNNCGGFLTPAEADELERLLNPKGAE